MDAHKEIMKLHANDSIIRSIADVSGFDGSALASHAVLALQLRSLLIGEDPAAREESHP